MLSASPALFPTAFRSHPANDGLRRFATSTLTPYACKSQSSKFSPSIVVLGFGWCSFPNLALVASLLWTTIATCLASSNEKNAFFTKVAIHLTTISTMILITPLVLLMTLNLFGSSS